MGCKKNISNTYLLEYLLQELPFYDELSIARNSNAFSGYARSYI